MSFYCCDTQHAKTCMFQAEMNVIAHVIQSTKECLINENNAPSLYIEAWNNSNSIRLVPCLLLNVASLHDVHHFLLRHLLDLDQLLGASALHPFYFDSYALLLLRMQNHKNLACLDFLFLPLLILPLLLLLLSLALSHFYYLMTETHLFFLLQLLLRKRKMILLLC